MAFVHKASVLQVGASSIGGKDTTKNGGWDGLLHKRGPNGFK